ncbi:hypothetical protein LRS13_04835 [Svornostia abyssi]|uniref:SnoaL-like domain-containing protein n=1 Tax=Svornostia abyssi TaxID=2898438 RepID=A0ABY5PJW9_9ACTN|nr:hypothetical protein LRS13_04835 [Parviterribacteraceae bacterium J379]
MGARVLLVLLAAALPGCGGDPQPEDVIRTWADTLRAGDVEGAADRFAVPSQVANGTAPERLTTRAAVESFNASLPCGARLQGTQDGEDGFVVATFVLTARRGGTGCGEGRGAVARVAIRVRDGKITDWVRVDDSPAAGPTVDT